MKVLACWLGGEFAGVTVCRMYWCVMMTPLSRCRPFEIVLSVESVFGITFGQLLLCQRGGQCSYDVGKTAVFGADK